jgi:transcriptional regulator with XRE-family HTH domain
MKNTFRFLASTRGNRSAWYVRNAEELRVVAGLTQTELVARAGVGRDTISKVERGIPVSRLKAQKIFHALNALHGERLKGEQYVSLKPIRKRSGDM